MTPALHRRRRLLGALCGTSLLGAIPLRAHAAAPIRIGLSAEFGMQGSRTAQAIERGILLAIDDINGRGGVLGRQFALESRDDRGVPARGVDNFAELAALPEMIAVFCGRYSPVAIEQAPLACRLGVLLLDPWAAADGIVKQPAPNYVFRVSANDTWAMQALLAHARRQKYGRLALLLPNTAWGRSSEAAALSDVQYDPKLRISSHWYNWGESDFRSHLQQIRTENAQALVMVANESEGIHIVRQMAALPPQQRLPILSHWGITGGDFAADAGDDLLAVDLVVVQTFSFTNNTSAVARAVANAYAKRFGQQISTLRGQVGFAHAYDLTHLLALAIRKAVTTDRAAVRNAMENLDTHPGLVRTYQRPFSPANHEGLERKQLFIARFAADGGLKAISH